MTNEEARAWLEHHFDPLPDGTKQSEAVSLAIKALETIPKYKDAYNKGWDDGAKATYEHLKMCEEEQEQETGHWIMSEDGLYRPLCDKCGAHPWKGYIPTVEEATEVFKYCPNCGCRMVEPQERSE